MMIEVMTEMMMVMMMVMVMIVLMVMMVMMVLLMMLMMMVLMMQMMIMKMVAVPLESILKMKVVRGGSNHHKLSFRPRLFGDDQVCHPEVALAQNAL